MNILTAALKTINNANIKGQKEVLIRAPNKVVRSFLEYMQLKGYISEIEYVNDHRKGKAILTLNGRLNKCGSICPRFDVPLDKLEQWSSRLLPARQFGHVVITTSKGILDHKECVAHHTGGKILGFFY
ncbi:small subunit ribosomal protein S15Ae [Nematocida homosporus]|uniref:small subunit ribosomal protein S15Ae n=1 Tax=Nematocida homosporus TaxID=1912981 RepID=UPI00221FABF2|nr:small subunit ribosomal protein S15Ae [Nematocida homosporus]KAI5186723.1 small subunit ribosomal protein S15Ae [Nematocida homosporus]